MSKKKRTKKKEIVQSTLGDHVEAKTKRPKKSKKEPKKDSVKPKATKATESKKSKAVPKPKPSTKKKQPSKKKPPAKKKPPKKEPMPAPTGPPLTTLPGVGTKLAEKLAAELSDASKGQGVTVKKREDTHRMAEANRAFAHYRW